VLHRHYNRIALGVADPNANDMLTICFSATLFASAVNIAIAHSTAMNLVQDGAFALLGAITGLIALGLAAEYNRTDAVHGTFDALTLAYQSFCVISGVYSLVVNGILCYKGKSEAAPTEETPKHHTALRFLLLGLSLALFGIVAALINHHWGKDKISSNFGSFTVPTYSWAITLFACAVFCSATLANVFGGIVCLMLTFGATLLGWAAQSVAFAADDGLSLDRRARAWNGVALATAILAVLLAHALLAHVRPADVVTAQHHDTEAGRTEQGVQLTADDFRKDQEAAH